jgi:7-cyano-7-deazaguanine synthase in queuosine biosynthesis
MKLYFSLEKEGIKVKEGNKEYSLKYPSGIWERYPLRSKEFLFDNLAHLLTINSALVKEEENVEYNTSLPIFKSFFEILVIKGLPHAVDDYKMTTEKTIKNFLNINHIFKDRKVKAPHYSGRSGKRAIITLSCGKDSLLSLALAKELGLNPIGVYINDTVSPIENRIKLEFLEQLSKEQGLKIFMVTNELEKLNDFETWGINESCVGYTHMMTGFSQIVLPFNYNFDAGYTIAGNQANMDFKFLNSEGYWTYPSFDQSREWMKQQNIMLGLATGGKVKLVSLIEGLTNTAIIKLLHGKYKEIGKYQISCDLLDFSDEKRWCHDCNKCCRLYMMMKAVGASTDSVGFHKDLLQKAYKKHYVLFGGEKVDVYEKSGEARDEQLFCFYWAYKKGVKGELMEQFRKEFLKEAEDRKEILLDKFWKVGEMSTVPEEIGRELKKRVEKELGETP